MKKLIFAWISILLMGLAGCGDDWNDRLLAGAEACMEARADSARWLLQQVDSTMTREQQACYALLWTQATHKCRIPLEGDSLINVAVEYYGGTGDTHRLAMSLLYKGLAHKQCGEVEQAVEAFVASEQAFDEVEDDQYKALLCNHYASILQKQGMLDAALRYYKKSYRYKLSGDSIHYIVSACAQIAKVHKMQGEMDSAATYYRRGFAYLADNECGERGAMFMQNYASFLISNKQYAEAERLLEESQMTFSGSDHIYNVYSSFSTLYYETGEYEKALLYGKKILDSQDSLVQCGGFLRLYRVYRELGDMETAVHYHDLYRLYHSDITFRRKTAVVAEIPHRMKAVRLEKENRTAHRWQWLWGAGLVVAVVAAIYIIRYMRRTHGAQMDEMGVLLEDKVKELDGKEQLLAEKQTLLHEIEQKMYDLKIELGRMKGAMSNQSRAMEILKEDRRKDRAAYQDSVRELKKDLKKKDEDHKTERKAVQDKLRELTSRVNLSEKEQNRWINEVKGLTEQMEQYELLYRYLLEGGNIKSVLLVLELKSGKANQRVPIRHEEYAELLKPLAEYARPGIRQLIETNEALKDKQVLACLIALGYDDIETLRIATYLKTNTVRAYCTQVKAVIEAPSSSPKGGEKNEERLSLTLPVREGTKLQNPPIVNSKN